MRNHDQREFAAQGAIRDEVFGPEFFERLFDAGEIVMGVEVRFSEAGEMLAAAQDAGVAETAEECARVSDDLQGIGGDRTRIHYGFRGFKGEVEGGSEVYVEAKGAAVFADDASVLAKELAVRGGEDFGGGGCGAEQV